MKKEKNTKIKTKDTKVTKVVKEKKVKEVKEKKDGFFKQTGEEMKKVSWPTRKDVLKYTLATIVFCLIVVGFFSLLNLGLSFIKGMFS